MEQTLPSGCAPDTVFLVQYMEKRFEKLERTLAGHSQILQQFGSSLQRLSRPVEGHNKSSAGSGDSATRVQDSTGAAANPVVPAAVAATSMAPEMKPTEPILPKCVSSPEICQSVLEASRPCPSFGGNVIEPHVSLPQKQAAEKQPEKHQPEKKQDSPGQNAVFVTSPQKAGDKQLIIEPIDVDFRELTPRKAPVPQAADTNMPSNRSRAEKKPARNAVTPLGIRRTEEPIVGNSKASRGQMHGQYKPVLKPNAKQPVARPHKSPQTARAGLRLPEAGSRNFGLTSSQLKTPRNVTTTAAGSSLASKGASLHLPPQSTKNLTSRQHVVIREEEEEQLVPAQKSKEKSHSLAGPGPILTLPGKCLDMIAEFMGLRFPVFAACSRKMLASYATYKVEEYGVEIELLQEQYGQLVHNPCSHIAVVESSERFSGERTHVFAATEPSDRAGRTEAVRLERAAQSETRPDPLR